MVDLASIEAPADNRLTQGAAGGDSLRASAGSGFTETVLTANFRRLTLTESSLKCVVEFCLFLVRVCPGSAGKLLCSKRCPASVRKSLRRSPGGRLCVRSVQYQALRRDAIS